MNQNKKKIIIALMVLTLCIGTVGAAQTEAASRPARPKFQVTKRTKKTATLKVKNSKGVTGYRIYLRVGKKGKWKLYDFALHSSTIKLTKLKSGTTYYVRLKAWKTKGRSIRISRYSKTLKISKYKKTSATSTPSPTPTSSPMPTAMPTPTVVPDSQPVTESAITVEQ